jgi:hypothetical protein
MRCLRQWRISIGLIIIPMARKPSHSPKAMQYIRQILTSVRKMQCQRNAEAEYTEL